MIIESVDHPKGCLLICVMCAIKCTMSSIVSPAYSVGFLFLDEFDDLCD